MNGNTKVQEFLAGIIETMRDQHVDTVTATVTLPGQKVTFEITVVEVIDVLPAPGAAH